MQLSNMVNSKSGGPRALGDFTCRKPMQWAISEYLCFSPRLPMPKDDMFNLNMSPGQSQVRSALVPYPSKCPGEFRQVSKRICGPWAMKSIVSNQVMMSKEIQMTLWISSSWERLVPWCFLLLISLIRQLI